MKPKVLLVTQAVGGVATHIEFILRYGSSQYDFTLISPESELATTAERMGVHVIRHEFERAVTPFADLRSFAFLLRHCYLTHYDLFHFHSSKAGALGRAATWCLGLSDKTVFTPNAISYLGFRGAKQWLFLAIERLLSRVGTLIAVSPSEGTSLKKALPSARIAIVVSGVESDDVRRSSTVPQPLPGQSIVFSGRLTYQKNPEMFLRVALELLSRYPKLQAYMIGSGYHDEFSPLILSEVERSGLKERFKILDWVTRDQNLAFIKQADVLLLSSRFESFGYIVAEAMICGKPVVATRVDGVKDVVADGETGFLVDVDDIRSMVAHVSDLLDDETLRRSMGEKGRIRAAEVFDVKKNIQRQWQVYNSLIEHTTVRR
jgi:glycosyltransferase involved in cell wall biosynthesis